MMVDALGWATLALIAVVGLGAFWDAPARVLGLLREGRARRDPVYHATNTLSVVVLALWLAGVLLGRVEAPVLGSGDVLPWPVRLAGVAVAGAGGAFALWSRAAMGAAFAPTLADPPTDAPVTRGPFQVVRHPFYVGAWLVLAGAVLAFDSRLTLAVLAVETVLIGVLARREERHLERRFGEAYLVYAHRVPRFVPRPWRRDG